MAPLGGGGTFKKQPSDRKVRFGFGFWVFPYRVSLCSPGCSGTQSLEQAGLELRSACLCLPSVEVKLLRACMPGKGLLEPQGLPLPKCLEEEWACVSP